MGEAGTTPLRTRTFKHAGQLEFSLSHTLPVIAVDDEDESLRVLEVVSPQRSNLVLPSDVPHREGDTGRGGVNAVW